MRLVSVKNWMMLGALCSRWPQESGPSKFPESYVERLWAVRHATAASALGPVIPVQVSAAIGRAWTRPRPRAGWGEDAVFP